MRPATTSFVLRKFGSYRSLPSLDNCPVVYTEVGRNVKGEINLSLSIESVELFVQPVQSNRPGKGHVVELAVDIGTALLLEDV